MNTLFYTVFLGRSLFKVARYLREESLFKLYFYSVIYALVEIERHGLKIEDLIEYASQCQNANKRWLAHGTHIRW